MLSRGAIAANLDALADAWAWTTADMLVHALPLFHVHGLVLGVLGPLRRGGALRHLGTFSASALAAAVDAGATLVFGVPTHYHRLADELAADPAAAAAVGRARLLVSGSAALTAVDHARLHRLTGLAVRERYGLTETLILTAARADEPVEPGTVGRPLAGTEVRLAPLEDGGDGLGAVEVRGPALFSGYLNRPDATAAATTADGWFADRRHRPLDGVRSAGPRRPEGHGPDQVRRLQDRGGRDRERPAGAPGRDGGGGGLGIAGRRPRRARRRLRRGRRAGAERRAGGPRRDACWPRTSVPVRCDSWTSCRGTTWARSSRPASPGAASRAFWYGELTRSGHGESAFRYGRAVRRRESPVSTAMSRISTASAHAVWHHRDVTTPRDPVADLRRIAFLLERANEATYRVRAFRGGRRGARRAARRRAGRARRGRHADRAVRGRRRDRPLRRRVAGRRGAGLPAPAARPPRAPTCDEAAAALRAALRGDCHTHSDWSDGGSPIEEMALAAVELGHEYLVLTDHSPRLTVARRPDRRPAARASSTTWRSSTRRCRHGFRILTGIEVDILADGSLDQERRAAGPARRGGRLGAQRAARRRRPRMTRADADRDRQPAPGHPRPLHRPDGRPAGDRAPAHRPRTARERLRRGRGLRRLRRARQGRRDQLPAGAAGPAEAAAAAGASRPAACSAIDTDAHAPGQLDWLDIGCERAALCGVPATGWSTPGRSSACSARTR